MAAPVVRDLFRRRVPQILAVYLGASWGILEFVDWLVGRYPVSPHLVELSLVLLASLIPTVVLIAYFHGGPGDNEWTRAEKVGIPVNLVFSGVLLWAFWLPKTHTTGEAVKPKGSLESHRQLTYAGTVKKAAIAPDGVSFAYASGKASEHKLVAQEIAGGSSAELAEANDLVLSLRWAPDGSGLLVADPSGARFLTRLGGSSRQMPGAILRSGWSPDGRRLATIQAVPGAFKKIILVDRASADTSSIELDGSFDYIFDVDWSPGGEFLALATEGSGEFAIWTASHAGEEQHELVTDSVMLSSPRWSSNGSAVYYLRTSDTSELWKASVSEDDGRLEGPPELLLAGLQVWHKGTSFEFAPSFTLSRDGRRLLYVRDAPYSNLWVVSADRSKPEAFPEKQEITEGTALKSGVSISPDGEKVAFAVAQSGRQNIHTMPIDGGPMQQLTSMDAHCASPEWSPDGKRVAFASNYRGAWRVWVVDVGGG